YLIDGYNLAHALGLLTSRPQPRAAERARRRLLAELRRLHGQDGSGVTVVFDAVRAPPGVPDEEDSEGIRVLFARRQNADDVIEDLLRREPAPHDLTVVSNDRRLRESAQRRGCGWLGCVEYLEHVSGPPLAKPAGPPPDPDAKPAGEEDHAEWL